MRDRGRAGLVAAGLLAGLLVRAEARAELVHDTVSGAAVTQVALRSAAKGDGPRTVGWDELGRPKVPGLYEVRFKASGAAVLVPHCNGRERILVDNKVVDAGSKGPRIVPLPLDEPGGDGHDVTVEIKASAYEKRLACSEPPRVGAVVPSGDGLVRMAFASPERARGGGEAVVFVPGGHDRTRPAPLLVGTHPWNGGPWTYAAYQELLDEAGKRGVVLLMPSGLGNSLYVADAEEEVMRAIAAVEREVAVDRQRVSIWGASMGGAGATTIAFHHPDRFAFVASYFGDSRYDLTTYVKTLLGGPDGARKVNALDVLENARHLPVLLVHGEDDHTSPMRQSTMLDEAMRKAGFSVELRREPGMGHEGPLVVKHVRDVVARAATAVAPRRPSRVSFRSVRPGDDRAYGVRIVRDPGRPADEDAFVDVERRSDGKVHVLAARGVSQIVLAKDALGGNAGDEAAALDVPPKVTVAWER